MDLESVLVLDGSARLTPRAAGGEFVFDADHVSGTFRVRHTALRLPDVVVILPPQPFERGWRAEVEVEPRRAASVAFCVGHRAGEAALVDVRPLTSSLQDFASAGQMCRELEPVARAFFCEQRLDGLARYRRFLEGAGLV